MYALGTTRYAAMAFGGTCYWIAFVSACAYVHPLFTFCTLVYAFVEGNLLLAVVQIG